MTEHPLGHVPDTTEAPDSAERGLGLPLSIDDVLAIARRVEREATICLRADLEADYDAAMRELATLVTSDGKLIEQPDASVGEASSTARANELNERAKDLRRQMQDNSWTVRFRAMDSDAWAVFTKAHLPQVEGADLADFNTRLISAVAIEPTLSVTDVEKLRKALSTPQMAKLARTAWQACTEGGLDIPKSLSSWLRLAQP